MKKRIIKGFVCLISMTTFASGMAIASYAYQVTSATYKATFSWGYAWAKMKNNKNTTRYATAVVTTYDNTTGAPVCQDSADGVIGYNEYVYASCGYDDPEYYNWTLSGSIYRGSSSHSPCDWTQSHDLP
jgi:hypothetical protein